MVDKEKIEKLFSELDEYLLSLNELKTLPLSDYVKEKRNIYSGRYLLQISIETCINIGNHLISTEKLGLPKEYADTFRILAKSEIISNELVDKLILMTRFRNRIVHLYWDIDDEFIKKIIETNLEDFNLFQKAIKTYLKKY
jgi:uncharacterized protein YutE (UPF0331/DUF86 family)